ncbi:unnamed protein product [Caenorhabditis brenneri]
MLPWIVSIVVYVFLRELYANWPEHWPQLTIEYENDEESQRHRDNLRNRIEETLREPVHECPICFSGAKCPVMTDCGHIFCCECIVEHWKQSRPTNWEPCDCTYCRCTVYMLHRVRWPSPGTSADQLRQNNKELNDYNWRFWIIRPTQFNFIEEIVDPNRFRKFFRDFCHWVEEAPIALFVFPLAVLVCGFLFGILLM